MVTLEDEAPATRMTDEHLRQPMRPPVGSRSFGGNSAVPGRFTSAASSTHGADSRTVRPPRVPSPERAAPSGEELRQVLQELLERQTRDHTQILEELMRKQTASILDALHNDSHPPTPTKSSDHAKFGSESHLSNSQCQELELDLGITKNASDLTPNTIGKSTSAGVYKKPKAQLWRARVEHFKEVAEASVFTRNFRSVASLAGWFQGKLDWLENVPPEPERHRWVDDVVRSQVFNVAVLMVILVHTMIFVHRTNTLVEAYGNGDYSEPAEIHVWLEAGFTSFYTVELLLRICSSDIYFVLGEKKFWNLFDFVIVLVSIVSMADADMAHGRLTWLRSLRILRVVMMARIARLVRSMGVGSLHLMVKCMLGTLTTLGWCIVLMVFITFMFSVFFVQSVADGLLGSSEGQPIPDDLRAEVLSQFGSVQAGMLTLIMSITGGIDWKDAWAPLELAGDSGRAFFLFYILFASISLWNIITSIFVEKAIYYARPDADARHLKARRDELERASELHELFARMDIDSSKTVSLREFADFVANNEFITFLHDSGIDPMTAHTFFEMLLDRRAHDDEQLDIEEIITACLHIDRPASSMDVSLLRYELKDVKRRLPQARPPPTNGRGN